MGGDFSGQALATDTILSSKIEELKKGKKTARLAILLFPLFLPRDL